MTEQRPIQPTPVGALRFNTDSAKLEYFDGNEYVNITTDSPEQNTGGTRAVMAGGGFPNTDVIDFVNIDVTGNAVDFGDLTRGLYFVQATASRTKGNAADFGNLTDAREQLAAASSKTRGIFAGGYDQPSFFNIIDFITIASTGNASDFGDLTFGGASDGKARGPSGCSDNNGGLL